MKSDVIDAAPMFWLEVTSYSATSHDFAPRRVERRRFFYYYYYYLFISGADFADITTSVALPKEICGRSL